MSAENSTGAGSRVVAQFEGAAWGEPNMPMPAQSIVLKNDTTEPQAVKVSYLIQHDTGFFSLAPPDPIYGADRALGVKSWTAAEGKVLETGSLTDGKDWTNASLPWGSHKEAFQYVDLGQERTVTHLSYVAGDANWAWKVDVSASPDGETYEPVAGLQNVDMHGKWGFNQLPVTQPFKARFIRLRYHNGGQDVNQISMPSTLSIYSGAADEKWEFPTVGDAVAHGDFSRTIAAHSSRSVKIESVGPFPPGAYFIAARVQDGAYTQLLYRHLMVMPAPLPSIANSSFGLNTSNYLWAPVNRRLGIGWVRFENLKWPMVSPKPDVYTYTGLAPWNLHHDEIMKAYHDQGINILPFLFQTPEYATSAPDGITKNRESYPPKDNMQLADFVFQTVARYGSKHHPAGELKTTDKKSGLNEINTFEIWNEPNLHDPTWGPWVGTTAQYNKMLRAAAGAVKRADPAARVTNGGFAGIDIDTLNTLLIPYEDGKKPLDFIDVLNVHFYSGRTPPELSTVDSNADRSGNSKGVRTYEDDLHRLVAWRDKYKPNMPIWMSETGYDSAGPSGTDERTQAAQLPRVIMMALAAGVEKVFVYRESGSAPSLFAASGVMRDDGSLKPAWFTYATLIRELDRVKTGAIRLPYPDPNVRLYSWTRGTEKILTAWTVEGAGNLNLHLGSSMVTDAFGYTHPADIDGNLTLSIFPTYINKITNLAPVQTLIGQAQRIEAAQIQEGARRAKLRAYLFQFGITDNAGSIEIGNTRSFT
nr:discoidin domain-containing protein [Armatimonadota bacterium]